VAGDAVGVLLAAGISVGVSVGVSGRGMKGVPGTSLAWLAGPGVGEGDEGGLLVGLDGAGAGAEGQRPHVAAQ